MVLSDDHENLPPFSKRYFSDHRLQRTRHRRLQLAENTCRALQRLGQIEILLAFSCLPNEVAVSACSNQSPSAALFSFPPCQGPRSYRRTAAILTRPEVARQRWYRHRLSTERSFSNRRRRL